MTPAGPATSDEAQRDPADTHPDNASQPKYAHSPLPSHDPRIAAGILAQARLQVPTIYVQVAGSVGRHLPRVATSGTLCTLPSVLDQLLLPQRFAAMTMQDLRRIADAAVSVGALANDLRARPLRDQVKEAAAIMGSLRDEVSGVRAAVGPMSRYLDGLRAAFAGTNDELQRLREEFVPQLAGVRAAADGLHEEVKRQREQIGALNAQIKEMGEQLAAGITSLDETIKPLVRDAGEMREVVEPLQSATERVGRVAERLPGPGRKK